MTSNGDRRYQYDRERVVTHDLAVVLKRFIQDWEAERPRNGTAGNPARRPKTDTYMGAVDYISQKSGIHLRALARILSCETFSTSYYLADRILVAVGMEHHLGQLRELSPELSKSMMNIGHKKKSKFKFKSQEEWLDYLDSIGCRR